MPQRHGLYRSVRNGLPPGTRITAEQAAGFRYGIAGVFENLRVGPFLTNPADKIRVSGLQSHFTEVTQRLVFSLQQINDLMQQMAAEFAISQMSMSLPKITLEAGCHADHVLTYLNSMLDDIAHCIMFSTGFVSPDPKRPIDSMGGLKRKDIRSTPALAPVSSLLSELDDSDSWWKLGFKAGVGARQLLIHNQHVVAFQGSQSPGCPMEANAFLLAPFAQKPVAGDFFVVLRELFAKLCDWLDRLEAALTSHLPIISPPGWPKGLCPRILLPLGHPMTGVQLSEAYFPLPLCDGSDALPWEFGPPSFAV
jgi:hypothetical protein